MKIHIAELPVLARLLNRKKKQRDIGYEVDLSIVLKEILTWADRLVPSEAGSVLLDDPIPKLGTGEEGRLYFSACFGKGSASLVGSSMPDSWGIAGEAYQSGRPYISRDVSRDTKFYSKISEKLRYETRSIICVPIRIEDSIIGVIELINRRDRANYDGNDLALLEIFAGYTATLILNALIARSFGELSKRDNLTGLYNDRYFFHSLEHEVEKTLKGECPVSLIFFDLDRFKEINDNHGHLAGSSVLKEVADLLRDVFAGTAAVMSRYGGDEYVIILPETKIEDAKVYAAEVRKKIAGNTFLSKRGSRGEPPLNIEGVITCSIGVAALSKPATPAKSIRETAEALIRSADTAMYEAKDSGKNRVCVARRKCRRK